MSVHSHGSYSHDHAWGDEPHDHLLRALCMRHECEYADPHNVHRGGSELPVEAKRALGELASSKKRLVNKVHNLTRKRARWADRALQAEKELEIYRMVAAKVTYLLVKRDSPELDELALLHAAALQLASFVSYERTQP